MHNDQDLPPSATPDPDGTTPENEPALETTPAVESSTGDAIPGVGAAAAGQNSVDRVAFIPGAVASESLAATDADVWFAQSSPATTISEATTSEATTSQASTSEEVAPEPHTGPVCPWCSKPVTSGATACPSCGALLVPKNEDEIDSIPGVTEIDPRLLGYQPKPQKPQKIVDFLIQFVEEDDVAEAARKRLATKSKPRSKKKGPASNDPPSQ